MVLGSMPFKVLFQVIYGGCGNRDIVYVHHSYWSCFMLCSLALNDYAVEIHVMLCRWMISGSCYVYVA